MSFDQLSYRKIPIWENCRRTWILTQFRDLLHQFLQPLGPDAVFVKDRITEQRKRLINQAMPAASQFIRLAGLSSTVSDSQREYLSNKSKAAGIDAKLDLLDGFLWQETPGLRQQALDLVDQAIGVYNGNKSIAWFNTFWPFFWLGIFADWIAGIPFRILGKLGFEKAQDTSRGMARLIRGIFSLLVEVVTLVYSVLGILQFFGVRESFLRLFGFK